MIYHITTDADWDRCKDEAVYAPSRFEEEGFIHNSTDKQVSRIANRIFKAYDEVWLLFVDDEREKDFIKYENLDGGAELFPHIYRKLPKTSIVKMVRVKKGSDGSFDLSSVTG